MASQLDLGISYNYMPPHRRPGTLIVVSDSSDDTPLLLSSRKVARSPSKRKRQLQEPEPELIEISSSDDETPPSKRQATLPLREKGNQLRQEVRTLRQRCSELEKVKDELEHAHKENGEPKLRVSRSDKIIMTSIRMPPKSKIISVAKYARKLCGNPTYSVTVVIHFVLTVWSNGSTPFLLNTGLLIQAGMAPIDSHSIW
ncbi:hypothetical protein C8R43DRAFT_955259 [Mycena crocata]|nr:hypothetical protein C8R43DRAFT_955259 [Mycena crocata]